MKFRHWFNLEFLAEIHHVLIVVYFDQPFAGQNQFFDAKTTFPSLTEQSKEKRKESRTKTCNKRDFLLFLHYFTHLMIEKDVKSCFNVKKLISTSERDVEHLFAGQNTQQMLLQLNEEPNSIVSYTLIDTSKQDRFTPFNDFIVCNQNQTGSAEIRSKSLIQNTVF